MPWRLLFGVMAATAALLAITNAVQGEPLLSGTAIGGLLGAGVILSVAFGILKWRYAGTDPGESRESATTFLLAACVFALWGLRSIDRPGWGSWFLLALGAYLTYRGARQRRAGD